MLTKRSLSYLGELSLADSVAEEYDALGFSSRCGARDSVIFAQDIVHHAFHILNVLLLRLLDANLTAVLRGSRVDGADYCSNRRLVRPLVRSGVSYVRPKKDNLFLQNWWTRKQNCKKEHTMPESVSRLPDITLDEVVCSSHLRVEFQANVRRGRWIRSLPWPPQHILELNALCDQFQL